MSCQRTWAFILSLLFLVCSAWGCKGSGNHPEADRDGLDGEAETEVEVEADPDPNGDTDLDSDLDGEDVAPPLPDLRPLSREQAIQLAQWVRRMHTQTANGQPRAMAWSLINQSCQDRALVEQYAIHRVPAELAGADPVTMREAELTDEALAALFAATPAFDAATINITGPLITEQTFVDQEGQVVAGQPFQAYWAYHHSVVVNVAGELSVLDLSTGDEPLPIAQWYPAFVEQGISCAFVTEEEYQETWSYWLSAMGNWVPDREPAHRCAYTITPAFRFRWDQEPLTDVLKFGPATMETQIDAFLGILGGDYGLHPTEEQAAQFTSHYTAKTVYDMCAWVWMNYCDTLPPRP